MSELESRQYVTFESQPKHLTLRLDYTGIFSQGLRMTEAYELRAKIFSIASVHPPD